MLRTACGGSSFSLAAAWPSIDPDVEGRRPRGDHPRTGGSPGGVRGRGQTPVDFSGIAAHVESRRRRIEGPAPRARPTGPWLHLGQVVLHSPGNSAYRALGRVLTDETMSRRLLALRGGDGPGERTEVAVQPPGRHEDRGAGGRPGASLLAQGASVLRFRQSAGRPRRVPAPPAPGPVQSDRSTRTGSVALAKQAAEAMSLRTTTYQASTSRISTDRLRSSRGSHFGTAAASRTPKMRVSRRCAPHSTARSGRSCSRPRRVGQEGIDFHWWCHSVFHWNTPANPVDFEQREGRVDRYRGHAVRRNIAARHGQRVLAAPGRDPWATAFALADDYCEEFGDFTPSWVYPGPAKVERHVAPFALSSDRRSTSAQAGCRPLPARVRAAAPGGHDRAAAPARA